LVEDTGRHRIGTVVARNLQSIPMLSAVSFPSSCFCCSKTVEYPENAGFQEASASEAFHPRLQIMIRMPGGSVAIGLEAVLLT
jgi:hypothetical protein